MCEPDVIRMLRDKGKKASVRIHQRKSVERYKQIVIEAERQGLKVPVMPVLQGWEVEDYIEHWHRLCAVNRQLGRKGKTVEAFGWNHNQPRWVGIGSTCKRNKNPEVVSQILDTLPWDFINSHDVRIHLFGYKTTGLKSDRIKDRIYSADSFAYDFTNRLNGVVRKRTDRIKSAKEFGNKIVHNNVQTSLALA